MYNNALEILKILNKNKFEAYIIGGYPRDLYLGNKSTDIDICTNAKYKDLKKLFKEIKDNKYGSYKLKYKNQEYEITTYRKESKYLNNRFPKIKYTKKLTKDLKRRDFVINTLCIDRYGSYVDYKNAKKDLDEKIIRLIGPKTKIKEDSLRILRAIRFATLLDFKIEKKLDQALEKYKENLNNLSFDRKKSELEKILIDKNAQYGIQLIKKYKLEPYLKINLDNVNLIDDIDGIWAQILIDDSYNFKKEENKKIKTIQKLIKRYFDIYDLYKYGKEILEIVDKIKNEKHDLKKLYKNLQIKDRDEIDINFFEICEIKEISNETIEKLYEDIEKQIVYNNLKNKKSEIIKYIKKNY